MCGVVGFIDKKNQLSKAAKKRLIMRMRRRIDYRGGDTVGHYVYKNTALGHTRLSILDLSQKGKQPFFSSDKQYVISYNGELYNYAALNKKLAPEFVFKTASDTETLVNSYAAWGINCVKMFKGMFAFALLDRKGDLLHLAVDRFGIKPLYVVNNEDWFAFASEIKSLLLLPGITPQLDTDVLPEYLLYRHPSGSRTMFSGITKILPGQLLTFHLPSQKITSRTYWKIRKHPGLLKNDPQKEFLSLMNKSVEEHLVADAPVGLQLSGGVDSSLIAALAAAKKTTHFHSFSIGLTARGWNEFKYSRAVAKKLHTIHHELLFTEKKFCNLLPHLTWHMDEPVSHPQAVPFYILSKKARRFVKVLLNGEGADEVFGGYLRYLKLFKKKAVNNSTILALSRFGDPTILEKITSLRFKKAPGYRANIIKEYKNLGVFDKTSGLDIKTYLVSRLNMQDKMGMAANIETRVPFLDHHIVEFGFALPAHLKITPYETKPLIKHIATQFVPTEGVYRRKSGFGLPLSQWLTHRHGLGRYLNFFTNPNAFQREYLNYKEVKKIIQEHVSRKKDHGEVLWILINLEIWSRIFLNGVHPSKIWPSTKSAKK